MQFPKMSARRVQVVNLITGIVLLIISIIEIFEETDEIGVELEHGLALFALAHIIKVGSEMLETSHKIIKAKQ